MNSCLIQTAETGNETDKLALLEIKKQITDDPFGALSTWNNSLHFCRWEGVACGRRHQRVVALDLRSQNLEGTISPHIGNLTFLRGILLGDNRLTGEVPEQIGRLYRLRVLSFSQNSLKGKISTNITLCKELRTLDLVQNQLTGTIPPELGILSNLDGLGLAVNNLTGSIPTSLMNLSALTQLSLSENSLSGHIPSEIGRLRRLKFFQVSANNFLTGSIPTQLFNISSISYLGLSANRFYGEIPSYIGYSLPNLRILYLSGNRFTGPIPASLANASRLEWPAIANNYLTGSIPESLGNLKNLYRLNLAKNNLGSGKGNDLSFISSLVNCTRLDVLSLSENNLSGVLPSSIANLSSRLNFLAIGANQISGTIPTGIEKLVNLSLIGMEENLLTGVIPFSIGKLPNLRVLSLFGNSFTGEIPSSIGNVTFLVELGLENNLLQGSIPFSLGNCRQLQRLGLAGNNLSGSIPKQVIGLSSVTEWLDLSQNSFTGPIPTEIGNLENLQALYLSDNKLTGEIPEAIEKCITLTILSLQNNSLQGRIPLSLSSLKSIEVLDLSSNNFSGEIPDFLGKLSSVRNLNLSFNNLEGKVPREGIFRNVSAFAVIPNANLCGGILQLHLHPCPPSSSKKARKYTSRVIIVIASLTVTLSIIMFIFTFFCWKRNTIRKPTITSSLDEKYVKVSYTELVKATDGFSSSNLIGNGSYGSVYKGMLDDKDATVAIKILDLKQRGATKSFLAECEALRNIRHRNLLKVITSCSSVDFKGNEFKALVYEFMSNGSLEEWLHATVHEADKKRNLNLIERLNIALDVANALDYLHHCCQTPIVHCDLKPNNVLLDEEMIARVGDFGLARFIYNKSNEKEQTGSSRITGSIGYLAPEYGVTGKVSTEGDVYSYGILLLEMFTGKRPTDEMFKDGLTLHNFARAAIPDGVLGIIDPTLQEKLLQGELNMSRIKRDIYESLVSIFRIGVSCSNELPRDRVEMKDVIGELQAIRNVVAGN